MNKYLVELNQAQCERLWNLLESYENDHQLLSILDSLENATLLEEEDGDEDIIGGDFTGMTGDVLDKFWESPLRKGDK